MYGFEFMMDKQNLKKETTNSNVVSQQLDWWAGNMLQAP
jgi:hypothetical protein